MSDADTFMAPPDGAALNHEGKPRRVGVEIEFAAVTAEAATEVVQNLFGGEIRTIDPHQFDVLDTELGDFRCELDLQYAHKAEGGQSAHDALMSEFGVSLRQLIGDMSAIIVPCEVVCPPVELDQLARIDRLREELRKAGAAGTGSGLLYAFGAQFNPEIASGEAGYLTSMMKSYLLLTEWLREEIQIDPTRQLLTFADPFPEAYSELVLAQDYWPGQDELIDNHLAYNPTRNRELDMLPLFAWLDEPRVRAVIDDPRIKPRPTFHYRLPDASLQNPDWTVALEWNRWCQVEYLAASRERLDDAAAEWAHNRTRLIPRSWAHEVRQWLV